MSRTHIVQYHEVIGGLIGPWGEQAALFFNVVSLVGLTVVQIIACASDAYYLYSGLNKRYVPRYAELFDSKPLFCILPPVFMLIRRKQV